MFTPKHIPVLLRETLEALAPKPDGNYLDCTFGGGGHSRAILEYAGGNATLSAIDRDPAALPRTEAMKKDFGENFRFYALPFSRLDEVPEAPFDGILMDIGVSSFQLDDDARGFSFRKEARADMRMDTSSGCDAAEFLETASWERLVEAVRDYGEELRWRRVVDAIIDARGTGQLSTTTALAALIERAAGKRPGEKIHPATRTFQGVRIAVNDELGELKRALPKAFSALKRGGVLAVISFHSLEDRIVKRFFNEICGRPIDRSDSRPQDERSRVAEMLTRKAVRPSEEELSVNPRSRSSRLRAVKKI
ncbi:MAG: 16S rRNA (cytosine(1402)-N(4))-methyltransferase RsmH [Opitutales bacterium]|nr:16S rRNA (cytosine(1402)-N(4))-methyltransferase RsmH [Opitutales bacterium]